MGSPLTVRPARVEDVAQMARVNVRCWQETYRGLMPDAVLDDPGFVAARERFWTAALTDERYHANRAAVAERDGEVIGIAMSGPPLDAATAWTRQLYVLYVRAAEHGRGAGPALLAAVIDPEDAVALWVADPNPRAQAFYRKHGFVADGATQVEEGVREIRMVRDVRQPPAITDATLTRIGQGVEMHHGRGERDAARRLFEEIWDEIGGEKGDPLHVCVLAHSMADVQDDVRQELLWDQRALAAADLLTDERTGQAGVALPVAGLYPSLHLNLADCYRKLGDAGRAREHLQRARSGIGALGDDEYGTLIKGGLERLTQLLAE
ncbi:GNAT family N-acetyltransferase [Actinoplanes sp. GCM10030250]|uniref:GNAT family N-acetyltransferase n=1 Tax=Actinoplanes sp. GCM10030250 TaxID=3273376 RepID=UPI003615C95F